MPIVYTKMSLRKLDYIGHTQVYVQNALRLWEATMSDFNYIQPDKKTSKV